MNINENINLLKNILNKNKGYRPKIEDWGDDYILAGNKIYEINDDLIKLMNNYTKIYKQLKKHMDDKIIEKYDDNIAIIFLMENKKNPDEKYVGYTTYNLLTLIKVNIHLLNLKQENLFDKFSENDIR